MLKEIESLIETIKEGYIHDPNRIISDYRKEKESIADYQGREALELLQNAVDELKEDSCQVVEICLDGNLLRVSNTGNSFTFEGFKSLVYSNLSPKYKKDNYIGNKGTGFRSILNWAEKVKIFSGDLAVEFSESNARDLLMKIRSENPDLDEYCNKNEARMATLTAPRIIEKPANMPFDTVIEISLKESIAGKVREQLNVITPETLLFLPKLNRLVICNDGASKIFVKSMVEDGAMRDAEISTVKIEVSGSDGLSAMDK